MTLKSCFSVACTLSLNIENGYANMEGHSEPLGMESNTVSDRVPLTQVIAEVFFFFKLIDLSVVVSNLKKILYYHHFRLETRHP